MKNCYAILLAVLLIGCNDDDKPAVDPVIQLLVNSLANELTPLPVDPLQWTDEQLQFLDEVSDQDIVGLGEATHGTSEFFKAKHRILKYLAEKHGFKIFAIEADFGESLFINEAVLKSDKGEIENLMKNKMHFWTWKTTEVRDMLYWMCDYNNGKSNAEKIQYWGIDCQFNTFHPDMVLSQLSTANVSFIAFALEVLTEAKTAAANRFGSYSQSSFDAYLTRVDALTDSIKKYEEAITTMSSKRQYELTLRLTLVTRQAAEVMYYGQKQNVAINYRDKYMADNAAWLLDYFPGEKIVLWAHNYHVSAIYQSMGQNLKTLIPGKYTTMGFLFSTGQFTAVTQKGDQYLGITTQTLEDDPMSGSLNDVMHKSEVPAFSVSVASLNTHDEWSSILAMGMQHFTIGSVYNNNPSSYYSPFYSSLFDRMLYFDRTTAATQLK